ncbi:hypothetical protein [Stenotrophomonas maltophilia]|uniref:hypothetical protein n=1 Tax=Stenotrophomonas maltophilia TaxID=40324 RepID=UPI00209B5669|nr:hypothetical protein [Stenotrophomonas maltophilia]MCO7473037.1 hypothetical protein [Stenotrophomonas maltophilia]
MSTHHDPLPMIPELKRLTARDYLALLHFLWLGVSGLGAARCGWEMVTDKQATLSDVAVGVLLLCAPLIGACIWGGCSLGIAKHYRLI